jgi:hypothetical protein
MIDLAKRKAKSAFVLEEQLYATCVAMVLLLGGCSECKIICLNLVSSQLFTPF